MPITPLTVKILVMTSDHVKHSSQAVVVDIFRFVIKKKEVAFSVYVHGKPMNPRTAHHDPRSCARLPNPSLPWSGSKPVPPKDDACSPNGAKSEVAEPQFEPSGAIAPAANADCVATADSAKAVASIPVIV